MVMKVKDKMLDLLEEASELLVKEQIEFEVKIQENKNTLLEYMNEDFSKDEERSAWASKNDGKNLAKLPQMENVK